MTGAVCILTETYHPVVGGGETQARALGEGLAAGGWEVAILTRRSDAALKKVEQYDGLTVHRLRPVGSQHTRKWGLIFSALAQLWTLRRQYDLIFVSGFRILGIPAVMAAKLLGKPCVLKADSPGEMSGAFFTAGLRRIGLGRQSPA